MPGRYDRAVCATELRPLDVMVGKARAGWRPKGAFGVESTKADPSSDVDSGASETSTCSEVVRRGENMSDLYIGAPKFSEFAGLRALGEV